MNPLVNEKYMNEYFQMVTGDKENLSTNLSSIMSPVNTSLTSTPKSSIRPLTQAYQTVHAENEVTQFMACVTHSISYLLPLKTSKKLSSLP